MTRKYSKGTPGLVVGVVIADEVDNTKDSSEIMKLIAIQQNRIRQEFSGKILSEHPRIAVWRAAYSIFGAKPKDHRSLVENLYQMVLADKDIRSINPLVDCYNLVSFSTICRRWNWREDDRTKLTETTKRAILVIEGLQPVTDTEI